MTSEQAKGRTSIVSFPIGVETTKIKREIIEAAPSKTELSFNKGETEKETILVLEDDPTDLKHIEIAVIKSGLETVSTDSGKKALKLLKGNSIAGMFIDISLTNGMSGIAFMKRVMKKKRFKKVPKIAMAIDTFKDQKEILLKEGFDDFIAKPFIMEKIKKVLFEHLTDRQLSPF